MHLVRSVRVWDEGHALSGMQLRCRAQVRTLVQQEMYRALSDFDALVSPAAPTTAYRLGAVKDDPLEMYKGDLMTINVNLAGQQEDLPITSTLGC